MSEIKKLDTALEMALRASQEDTSGPSDDGISVTLRFEGSLAEIEALGFETIAVYEDQASGVIRFRDIPAIAAHPRVLSIAAGRRPRKDLHRAAPDALVRASTKANVNVDGVWHVTKTGTDWHSVANGSGAGVIVAILDGGIDYTHPMFMSQLTPEKKTRILSIWDQGLKPASLAECPDGALLQNAAKRYGVEYKQAAINAALKGTTPILHKDCDGHGTHVAGIAAGGRLFPAGGDASKVGVAPEADLIVVKFLDVPDDIRYRTAAGFGDLVGWANRFKDAVLYCLRVARGMAPKRPIVLNMSFGDGSMPGDGLDDDARWLDGVLDPTKAEDKDHVPAGAIVVKSAGNDGDGVDRLTATIKVPAGGEITVPLKLIDGRGGVNSTWTNCARSLHKPSLDVNFWYRANADLIKFALRLPDQAAFSADIGAGGKLEQGFSQLPGPPATVRLETFTSSFHRATLQNHNDPAVAHPDGGTVTRHNVTLEIEPKESSGSISYATGTYEVRIKAPAGTVIYCMCDEEFWGGLKVSFEVAKKLRNGNDISPTDIKVNNESSAVDTFGRHVITVASYQIAGHRIADSSSRGPLRDFSGPPAKGVIADKPDLAAPGVGIESAQSAQTDVLPTSPAWSDGVRFIRMGGTSMAAPFVAGVVALLLDKKPALKVSEVRKALTDAALTRQGGFPNISDPGYKEAFGSGMVHALESHKKV